MPKLVDCNIESFLEYSVGKKIFAIGTGRIFAKFFQYFPLEKQIVIAVDNDISKQGKKIQVGSVEVSVESMDKMVSLYDGSQIILITNLSSLLPILEQMDEYKKLKDAQCFHATMMMDRCERQEIILLHGKQKIPKKIHYCWFGHNPIPEDMQICIDSWREHCPDYEIIRWDESNYDVTKNRYMREAYEAERWGFVPDYARLDIIFQYGGLYFDTDIEVIRSFAPLLCEDAFFGFHNYVEKSPGLGFGAKPGHPFIKELMEVYEDVSFIREDGSINDTTCIAYSEPVFKKHGFINNNSLQRRDLVTVFPTQVLNPTGALGINNLFGEDTFSFNHSARSWDTDDNHRDYDRIKAGEWKRYI